MKTHKDLHNTVPAEHDEQYSVNPELEFAYKVRRALDEGIETMPENVVNRLYAARRMAVAQKKSESTAFATSYVPQFAGFFSTRFNQSFNWLVRLGIIIPLFVLILGSVGIYYSEQDRLIDELAELDVAVLADELPIDAYLDHGFDTYLSKHGE